MQHHTIKHSKLFRFESNANAVSDAYLDMIDQAVYEFTAWIGNPCKSLQAAIEFEESAASTMQQPRHTYFAKIAMGVCALGTFSKKHPVVQAAYELATKSQSPDQVDTCHLTRTEKLHSEALYNFANGNTDKAIIFWERALQHNPYDMLAIKALHIAYYLIGQYEEMRLSLERVFPVWQMLYNTSTTAAKEDLPVENPQATTRKPSDSILARNCFGFICGMYAFALEECFQFKKAEEFARKALEINPFDAWAIHALGHVFEMWGMPKEGIELLETSLDFWSHSSVAIHIWFHMALFYMDTGRCDKALEIYDTKIANGYNQQETKSGFFALDLVDATQILLRLELLQKFASEGENKRHVEPEVNFFSRWNQVLTQWKGAYPLKDHDHMAFFFDLHQYIAGLGSNNLEYANEYERDLLRFVDKEHGAKDDLSTCNQRVTKEYGLNLCSAMRYFIVERDYAQSYKLFKQNKAEWQKIGGSFAQRDFLNWMLAIAGLKSNVSQYREEVHSMLSNRLAERQHSFVFKSLLNTY